MYGVLKLMAGISFFDYSQVYLLVSCWTGWVPIWGSHTSLLQEAYASVFWVLGLMAADMLAQFYQRFWGCEYQTSCLYCKSILWAISLALSELLKNYLVYAWFVWFFFVVFVFSWSVDSLSLCCMVMSSVTPQPHFLPLTLWLWGWLWLLAVFNLLVPHCGSYGWVLCLCSLITRVSSGWWSQMLHNSMDTSGVRKSHLSLRLLSVWQRKLDPGSTWLIQNASYKSELKLVLFFIGAILIRPTEGFKSLFLL